MDDTTLTCFSYACSSQSPELIQRVKYSNKILLPPSILYKLQDETTTLFFKITNKENSFGQVCGVQEFTAPPGVVHIPYHIMEGIGLKVKDQWLLACPKKKPFLENELACNLFPSTNIYMSVCKKN